MTAAFEGACRTLGASEPSHPLRDIVAKKFPDEKLYSLNGSEISLFAGRNSLFR
jgi:hypothetical protein